MGEKTSEKIAVASHFYTIAKKTEALSKIKLNSKESSLKKTCKVTENFAIIFYGWGLPEREIGS